MEVQEAILSNVDVPTASVGQYNLLGCHLDVATRRQSRRMKGGHCFTSLHRSAGVDIASRVARSLHGIHDGFDCRGTGREVPGCGWITQLQYNKKAEGYIVSVYAG
jgi:hypothetical protein